jgi:hypothetical protein
LASEANEACSRYTPSHIVLSSVIVMVQLF